MGSDVADVNGDLRPDLFSANFGKEATPAIPNLIKAVSDDDREVRQNAIRTLIRFYL